jgi:hypothetical protein
MTANKDKNRLFIFKIIILTILMMAAFGAIVTCSILLATGGFSWLYLLALLSSLIIIYWSVVTIGELNKRWSKQMIVDIQSGKIASMTKWHHKQKEWMSYIEWRKNYDKEESMGMAIWAALLGLLIFFFSLYSEFDWMMLTVMTIVSAMFFGLVIGGVFYLGYRIRLKKLSSSETGNIIFTKNAIIVNNLLIHFNQMGSEVETIRVDKEDEWDLLKVVISTSTGERKNEQTYLIPIPEDKMDEAITLEKMYLMIE